MRHYRTTVGSAVVEGWIFITDYSNVPECRTSEELIPRYVQRL